MLPQEWCSNQAKLVYISSLNNKTYEKGVPMDAVLGAVCVTVLVFLLVAASAKIVVGD